MTQIIGPVWRSLPRMRATISGPPPRARAHHTQGRDSDWLRWRCRMMSATVGREDGVRIGVTVAIVSHAEVAEEQMGERA
jgi:hypothetical protein